MKKVLLIIMLVSIASCTVQKSSTILLVDKKENHPGYYFRWSDSLNKTNRFTKQFQRADSMFRKEFNPIKENRFRKQFQRADSMFNEKYKLR